MTRLTHLLAALALTGALACAIVAACGGPPLTPREVPPLAPRPERVDPTAVPVPTATDPATAPPDASRPIPPGPLAAVLPASIQLATASQRSTPSPDAGATPSPSDAGGTDAPASVAPADASADAYTPPLPPIPDGSLPADSRLEPIRLRD